jgi:hypothetical protein
VAGEQQAQAPLELRRHNQFWRAFAAQPWRFGAGRPFAWRRLYDTFTRRGTRTADLEQARRLMVMRGGAL